MRFWAIAGILASAVLLTAFVHHQKPKLKTVTPNPNNKYDIDELLTDLDE